MVPSTAICLLLLGAALLCKSGYGSPDRQGQLLRGAGVTVASLAIANLVVILSGTANGIDALFLPMLAERPHDAMSAATAFCLLLASICCFLLAAPGLAARSLYVPFATLGLLLCSVSLTGYAFGTAALYDVFIFASMALHTTVMLALLFVALMLSYGRGWIWLLLDEGTGSSGARRLFPIVVVGPPILCLLAVDATRAGYFRMDFGFDLIATAMTTFGLAAILHNAQIQNNLDQERVEILASLRSASADKDLLIREIYHRVKNNLQQINALIAIEAARHEDVEFRASFEEMSGRVQALGLVHQLLMQSTRPSEIDIAPFLSELGENISRSHGLLKRGIALTVESESEHINLDVAITIGLLINELVVNGIKHAFVDRTDGAIGIRYSSSSEDPAQRVIAVSDDGVGPEDLAATLAREEGGGTRIIRSLATQLHGNMAVTLDGGTCVTIQFPASTFQENGYARG